MDITININVSDGSSPPLPTGVFFGASTPVGEGGTTVDAPDGDYDSGNFTVASNILTVKSGGSPIPGEITVGNTTVTVVNGVSVATSGEMQAWLADSSDGTIASHAYMVVAQDITTLRADVSNWNGFFQQVPDDFIITGAYPTGTKPKLDYIKMQTAGTPASQATVTRLVHQYLHLYDPIDLSRADGITNVNYNMWEVVNVDLQGCEFKYCEFSSNLLPIDEGGSYPSYFQNGLDLSNFITGLWVHDCTFHNLMYPIRGNPQGALIEDNQIYDTLGDFLNPEGGTTNWIIRNNDCRGVIGDGTVLHADFNQHQIQTGADAIDGVFIFGNTSTPGEFWNRAWPQIDATAAFQTVDTVDDANATITGGTNLQRVRFQNLTAGRTLTLPAAASNDGQTFVVVNESDTYDITLVPNGSDTIEDSGVISRGTARYYSNGSSEWQRTPVGFATREIPVEGTKTLTSLYNLLLIGASAGANITLDSTATIAYIRKHDLTAGDVTITAPGGQTIEGGSSITISKSGGARVLSRSGTAWTISAYRGVTMQGCFGNYHPDFQDIVTKDFTNVAADAINNYNIAGNVFYVMSSNGIWIEQPVPNSKVCWNTVLCPVSSDFDGDGTVTVADGWTAGGIGKIRAMAYSTVLNNFTISSVEIIPQEDPPDEGKPDLRLDDATSYPPLVRDNVEVGITANPTAPTQLNAYFNGSADTDYQPTTKAEVLTSATLKSGSSMPANTGALGTTTANGMWDFVNKRFNLPAPAFTRVYPKQGSANVPLDAVMFIEANVPLLSLGTGTLALYNVTDATPVSATFAIYGNRITCTPDANLTDAKEYRITYNGVGIVSYFENLSLSIGNSSCDPVTFYNSTARIAPEIAATDWTFTADTAALPNKLPFFDGSGNDLSQYNDGEAYALSAAQRFDSNLSDDPSVYLPSGDAVWSCEVQNGIGSFALQLFTTGGSGANTVTINKETGAVTNSPSGTANVDYGSLDINGDGTWWRVWIKGNGSTMTRFYLDVNDTAQSVTVRRPMLVHANDPDAPFVVPLAEWVAP